MSSSISASSMPSHSRNTTLVCSPSRHGALTSAIALRLNVNGSEQDSSGFGTPGTLRYT